MITVYEENTRGRDFVIGDLHGCVTMLCETMKRKGFNPHVDRLFAVGDLVDRGPESEDVLQLLGQPWFHSVRGNHDQAAIDYTTGRQLDVGWYSGIGGAWLIGKTQAERLPYADAFEMLPYALEIDVGGGKRVGIVHADCPFADWNDFARVMWKWNTLTRRDKNQILERVMWSRERVDNLRDDGVKGIHAVIVGHTPQPNVTSLGNVYYVDTGAGKRGKLSMKNIKKLVGV